MSYFYLGIEANQRKNTYPDLSDALKDATWAANKTLYPIRVFRMFPHGISELVTVVRPEDPIIDEPISVLPR